MLNDVNVVRTTFKSMALFTALMATACAPSLVDSDETQSLSGTETESEGSTPTETGEVTELDSQEDAILSQVDASSETEWVYFDLDSGEQVYPSDKNDDLIWDLAFQRYVIEINGGVSGAGDVEVALAGTGDISDYDTAPSDGYTTDTEDVKAFDGWYSYNPLDHYLSPNEQVYVVHSSDGDYYKFQMYDYYDDAGTSGVLSFWWGEVNAPE